MYGRPLRRSAPPGSTPASVRRRWEQASESPDGTKPTNNAADEAALKVSILEAEIAGLRQRLAEVQVSRENLRQDMDDLRRDRDHWQKLAKSAEAEKERARTWFCGRASPRKEG